MKIISTNIGNPTTVTWKEKEVTTGIFKYPVAQPIFLEATDVKDDHVIDRKHHGGIYKACYLYGANHYPHWKALYPELDWNWGMFGENMTVDACDEENTFIGSIYQVGSAKVQVAQPRQPCFKLGIRFNDQEVLKHFINDTRSGIYFKILEPGEVREGDEFRLVEADSTGITVAQIFQMLFRKLSDRQVIEKAVEHQALPAGLREYIAGLVD
ncbi:MAG: MOSC domain-containing protein [Cytophagales bacterium]|nr:MOSC domain-containing protein [Cytophagales bacterium]